MQRVNDLFDPATVEADLAAVVLHQHDEPPAVTRRLHHRHQSWRTGVLLHQRSDCAHMTGRSELRQRTIELAPESSETVHHLCWDCLHTRPGRYRNVLARCLLRELYDRYTAGDHETATTVATQLDRLAGTNLRATVSARAPLPVSRQLLDRISLAASRRLPQAATEHLQLLAPHAAADGRLENLGDDATAAPHPDRAGSRRRLNATLERWWADLPAGALAHLSAAESTITPHPSTASEPDGHERPGTDPYRALQARWQTTMTALLYDQAELRRDHIRRRNERRRTVDVIAVNLNLSDSDDAETVGLPSALMIPLQQVRGRWGETLGVWRTLDAVAGLAHTTDDLVVVPAPSDGSHSSDVITGALKLAATGHSAEEAFELATAALTFRHRP